MRILLVGDQHFRFELPYSSLFPDGRRGEWEEVKRTIIAESHDCDTVVLLGDGLNSRHNHSSVLREFVEFLKSFGDKEIHVASGNHECYSDKTAIDFLVGVQPNWQIHTRLTNIVKDGVSLAFIPYLTPALLGVDTREEAIEEIDNFFGHGMMEPDVCFAHHLIAPRSAPAWSMMDELILPSELMEKTCKKSFFAHIHNEMKVSDKIQGTGSIFTHSTGEHERSVWKYNTETKTTERIPLPVRGIFKADDGTDISSIPAHSIVKYFVTERGTDLEKIQEGLSRFDASIIVEQYPSERTKIHLDGTSSSDLDLSIENLLKLYAQEKNVSEKELLEAFNLIKE